MKLFYLVIFSVLLFWQTGFAQDKKPVQQKKQVPVKTVPAKSVKEADLLPNKLDKGPEFPGGTNEYSKLLTKEFSIPTNNIPSGNYRVMVSFCIEADGTLTDIKILKDPGYGIGDEVKRVLPLLPKWKPSELNGKPARSTMSLPFFIKISD
jgi:hypothetical protein